MYKQPEHNKEYKLWQLILFSDIFVMLGYALAQIEKIL